MIAILHGLWKLQRIFHDLIVYLFNIEDIVVNKRIFSCEKLIENGA